MATASGTQGTAPRCGKKGCEKQAVDTLRFTDLIHTDLDTEHSVALCEAHSKEARRSPTVDAARVKKWLSADPWEEACTLASPAVRVS